MRLQRRAKQQLRNTSKHTDNKAASCIMCEAAAVYSSGSFCCCQPTQPHPPPSRAGVPSGALRVISLPVAHTGVTFWRAHSWRRSELHVAAARFCLRHRVEKSRFRFFRSLSGALPNNLKPSTARGPNYPKVRVIPGVPWSWILATAFCFSCPRIL